MPPKLLDRSLNLSADFLLNSMDDPVVNPVIKPYPPGPSKIETPIFVGEEKEKRNKSRQGRKTRKA